MSWVWQISPHFTHNCWFLGTNLTKLKGVACPKSNKIITGSMYLNQKLIVISSFSNFIYYFSLQFYSLGQSSLGRFLALFSRSNLTNSVLPLKACQARGVSPVESWWLRIPSKPAKEGKRKMLREGKKNMNETGKCKKCSAAKNNFLPLRHLALVGFHSA